MDLWKQAYRNQFGSDPDDDMAQYADDVEAWHASWQGGFDAGEEWATSLVDRGGENDLDEDDEEGT
jgi:hypothetical protein